MSASLKAQSDAAQIDGIRWHNFSAFKNLPQGQAENNFFHYCVVGYLVSYTFKESEDDVDVTIVIRNTVGKKLKLDLEDWRYREWFKGQIADFEIGTLAVFRFSDCNHSSVTLHSKFYRAVHAIRLIPARDLTPRQQRALASIDAYANVLTLRQIDAFRLAEVLSVEDWEEILAQSCRKWVRPILENVAANESKYDDVDMSEDSDLASSDDGSNSEDNK
ncbi:uncharacterized protein PFL1_00117 [Pseudozyma flocculosa PF-1]|uniref:uncharacterized protein n=1 Tax=Pseudozyma flocculosa PF-1 TaxID=1277687 RepID=UPI0004561A04|nr:uncharacterized protein PFL1_00117 [Pseudozyma flocculosa PF-1]EPQ31918.1 hypothetical protein PFL1_00117 [Pseudozyma flocculosa PF-1]